MTAAGNSRSNARFVRCKRWALAEDSRPCVAEKRYDWNMTHFKVEFAYSPWACIGSLPPTGPKHPWLSSVATELSFGWVWMEVCFWYTLKCGLKHHWANSGGKTPLTFSWHLSRSKAAMAKMFAAGGKMKNKAEKESEVTAATKPHSSSGLKINCNLGALSKFRFYPAGGW